MHVLGMCKIDKRKYLVGNKQMNAHQLITKYERKKGKYSRKYKSRYISLVVDYKGEPVRLFFIQYNRSKKWTLILTTDLTLSFVQAIEIYQIRWSIEVLFYAEHIVMQSDTITYLVNQPNSSSTLQYHFA